MNKENNYIKIFDTTLRDGEQSPGASMNIEEKLKLAVQVNGKTRDIIEIKKDLNEELVKDLVLKNSKGKKYIENSKIIKIIFVKNRVINYIISNKWE